jgi:phosphohistidine swiveling domain-containing protein
LHPDSRPNRLPLRTDAPNAVSETVGTEKAMPETGNFVVWLGRSPWPTRVGPKADYLHRAKAAGLPVPPGVLVLEEVLTHGLDQRWIQNTEEGFVIADREALQKTLDLPPVASRVAVRSAFSREDGESQSLAGCFASFLNVPSPEVWPAVCRVWHSSRRLDAPCRRDVLIMAMVDARHAGVAVTETRHEDDLVNVTEGLGDRLVSGLVAGETLHLPKLRAFEKPTETGFAGRLQRLLRDVRRVFGSRNWDVEFADDGRQCWLLQVRPLTRPVIRNEWFTYANHREILPPLPSPLMTSLIASCASDLFDYYRGFDVRLPEHRPFIEVFAGRPFINLSLLTDMMRLWGLPTRLVTDAIGGRDIGAQGWRWGRLARSLPALMRLGWAQLRAPSAAHQCMAWLSGFGDAPPETDSFANCVRDLQKVYTALVREMFSLTQAMSGPLALLRRLGVLSALAARHETVTTRLLTDLDPLREYVQAHPHLTAALAEGRVPEDDGFQTLWQAYLARYGFRGVFESDIACPRYHKQPETLLRSLLTERPRQVPLPLPWLAWLVYPLWQQARRALAAREALRHTAMQTFDRIRRRMKRLAAQALQDGRLPAADDLWLLDIEELRQLDGGWCATPDFLAARRQAQATLAGYAFPDVFRRFDNFSAFLAVPAEGSRPAVLQGTGLTRGVVEGRAWVCHTPSVPPVSTEPLILVAPAVDAGWVPVFAGVAGVVVEIGGDLSHGSIVLRELGLPAVTNVRQVTRVIRTGDRIRVQAALGVVEILASESAVTSLASVGIRG